jgi:hypothetical protein
MVINLFWTGLKIRELNQRGIRRNKTRSQYQKVS